MQFGMPTGLEARSSSAKTQARPPTLEVDASDSGGPAASSPQRRLQLRTNSCAERIGSLVGTENRKAFEHLRIATLRLHINGKVDHD